MALAAKVVGVSPASNPDSIDFFVSFSGNYGVNGVGDVLNLAPYDQVNNPGGFTNPNNIPLPEIPLKLEQAPATLGEDIGGYYTNPHPLLPGAPANGVAGGLSPKTDVHLRQYAPGGAELATNAAYNAAVIAAGAGVIVRMILPKDQ
jgi:hypothetical protein